MKSIIRRLAIFLSCLSLIAPAIAQLAGPPAKVDYQGQLLNSLGGPLTGSGGPGTLGTATNYTIHFRIWDGQTAGNLIWAEKQIVTVTETGLFSVRLGDGEPIADAQNDPLPLEGTTAEIQQAFAGANRFLGVTVLNPPATPGEISPRLAFLSSPFSFVAGRALAAETGPIGGFFGAEQIGIGTDNPSELLHLSSTGNAGLLIEADSDNANDSEHPTLTFSQDGGQTTAQIGYFSGTNDLGFKTNGNQILTLTDDGNVGIGDLNPADKLSVSGDGAFTGDLSVAGGLSVSDRVGLSSTTPTELLQVGNVADPSQSFLRLESGNVVSGIKIVQPNGGWSIATTDIPGGDGILSIGTGMGYEVDENPGGLGNLSYAADAKLVITKNGNVTIGGELFGPVPLKIAKVVDAALEDGSGSLMIGGQQGTNMIFDDNEIMARNDGVGSAIYINRDGGGVIIGSAGATTTVLGTFSNQSDREIKEDFAEVESQAILDRLVELPLSTWKYKGSEGRRHVGPVAQDFHAAFDDLLNLQSDDKTIAPLDEAGVAFASIQALHEIVEEKDEKIRNLEERLLRMEGLVERMAEAGLPGAE